MELTAHASRKVASSNDTYLLGVQKTQRSQYCTQLFLKCIFFVRKLGPCYSSSKILPKIWATKNERYLRLYDLCCALKILSDIWSIAHELVISSSLISEALQNSLSPSDADIDAPQAEYSSSRSFILPAGQPIFNQKRTMC